MLADRPAAVRTVFLVTVDTCSLTESLPRSAPAVGYTRLPFFFNEEKDHFIEA